jgi:hypothetical protein
MARQGFDLQLTRYDERGWRATFYITSATASAWERTPWQATQRAAWRAFEDAGLGSVGRTPPVVPQDEVVGMELGTVFPIGT